MQRVLLRFLNAAGIEVLAAVASGAAMMALGTRLTRAVDAKDWPAGGAAMAKVRVWVSVNFRWGWWSSRWRCCGFTDKSVIKATLDEPTCAVVV
jgi:hypothetical protein